MKVGIGYSLRLLRYKISYLESTNGKELCIYILKEFEEQLKAALERLEKTGNPNSYSQIVGLPSNKRGMAEIKENIQKSPFI